MSKRILVLLSERGFWGEELVGPLEAFDAQGYSVDFLTPTGKRPEALPPSMDAKYIDPPLGRSVTSEEMAQKSREWNESPRLDNTLSLESLFPERPYMSSKNYLRDMEAYWEKVDKAQADATDKYDALLIVGGSGPIVDLVNNQRVHDLILAFYKKNKLVAAECYGVACLAFARDWNARRSILQGKRVTGHCLEYDYHDGTGFIGVMFNFGPPPYPLEFILRDATAPGGEYVGNVSRVRSVIVDYPFVTSRSTPDSYLCGEKMVEVLEQGLTRWGW
jgi:putative intracellular protease/amidase